MDVVAHVNIAYLKPKSPLSSLSPFYKYFRNVTTYIKTKKIFVARSLFFSNSLLLVFLFVRFSMAGLQYYFFPTDFFYPLEKSTNADSTKKMLISVQTHEKADSDDGKQARTAMMQGRQVSPYQTFLFTCSNSHTEEEEEARWFP